jgi:hypothetical protein
MGIISEKQYKEAVSQISSLGGEIKRFSSIINDYHEQEKERKYLSAMEFINKAALPFREGFAVLVERAIASRYGTLDDYVRKKNVPPAALKKFLSFHTSGGQLLSFIFLADMSINVTNSISETTFFPRPNISELASNERIFRQQFEKLMSDVINKKPGGRDNFKTENNFDHTSLNKALYFDFKSETDLFKVLHFTGSTIEILYKYEKIIYPA